MTFPLVDQSDAFLGGPNEDLASSVEVDDDFVNFAPAAFEQARSLLSIDAVSDLRQLGAARSSVDRPAVIDVYSGIFQDSDDGENLISPEEANAKYGFDDNGEAILSFNKPVSAAEAGFIRGEKVKELSRLRILDRLQGTDFFTSLGVELLADFADPLGLATVMLPVARANTFRMGFLEGAGAAGITIAPGTFKNTQIQAQFQAQEAVLTIIAAGALSGGLNRVIGKLGEPPKPPEKTKEQVFDEEVFGPVLIDRLNGGKDENLPEKLVRLKEAQKDVQNIKDLRNTRTELSDLKRKVLEKPDTPERAAQVGNIDRTLIDLKNKETEIRRKDSDKSSKSIKDIKSGLEQEAPDKGSILTGKEKVTKVRETEDPTKKESRQADELEALSKELETLPKDKKSIEGFVAALARVLGKDNDYDELLQAALDDPAVLSDIFAKLENLKTNETTFSKADGFNPSQVGGAEERDLTQGDFFEKGPVSDAKRSDIKGEIRQALGAVRSRVSRAQPDAPRTIDVDPVKKAAQDVKSSLSETLREPNTAKNIDETIQETPEIDVSMNHSDSVMDMEDINNGFEVQSIETLEDLTQGRAGNLEELEELLENLKENPEATELDIANMEETVRIARDKEEALTRSEKLTEGFRDALDCATGGFDG